MPTPANLSFETTSGTPLGGGAASWTLLSTVSALDYALFGTTRGYEAFEAGWGANENFVYAFTIALLEEATFATVGGTPIFYEGFDRAWDGNESFEYDFAGLEALSDETFEDWAPGYLYALAGIDALAAETFSAGWGSYFVDIDGASITDGAAMLSESATWAGAIAYSVDAFLDVRPGGVALADTTADAIVAPGHAFVLDDIVRFAGSPPAPLQAGVWYFVVNPTPGVLFHVSATLGGAAIDLTGAGSGSTFEGDPARYWTTVMQTI